MRHFIYTSQNYGKETILKENILIISIMQDITCNVLHHK